MARPAKNGAARFAPALSPLAMDYLTFWRYVQQGLEIRELVVLVLGVGLLIFSGFWAPKLWRDMRQQKPLTYDDVLAPIMGVLMSAVCFFMMYWGVRTRYLLRAGATRYTVGKVFEHSSNRGNDTFVYEYYVAGQRYQSAHECGPEDWRDFTCPDLGVRLYVRFSPEDPSTDLVVNILVPDSVRTIPPLGWARLP